MVRGVDGLFQRDAVDTRLEGEDLVAVLSCALILIVVEAALSVDGLAAGPLLITMDALFEGLESVMASHIGDPLLFPPRLRGCKHNAPRIDASIHGQDSPSVFSYPTQPTQALLGGAQHSHYTATARKHGLQANSGDSSSTVF